MPFPNFPWERQVEEVILPQSTQVETKTSRVLWVTRTGEILGYKGSKLRADARKANAYSNVLVLTSPAYRKVRNTIAGIEEAADLDFTSLLLVAKCFVERKPTDIRTSEGVNLDGTVLDKPLVS